MKILIPFFAFFMTVNLLAAVPTEEGLLKNLNNANIPGNIITLKFMTQTQGAIESDGIKTDYYKFIISLENPSVVGLMQVQYSNAQMLNNQIKDVKYIPDLFSAIRKEKSNERGMFYAILSMLSTNKSEGMELFLDKVGVQIIKNKNIINEDKMKLLRSYRTYLATNKGKGDANSPLNPSDPQLKSKAQELFRANTFERAKNIELVKVENQFAWKANWKEVTGLFSNEERQLISLDYNVEGASIKLEAKEYVLFNGTNGFPKFINFKDSKGMVTKIQTLSVDTKTNRDKKISDRYEEVRKVMPVPASPNIYSFLF